MLGVGCEKHDDAAGVVFVLRYGIKLGEPLDPGDDRIASPGVDRAAEVEPLAGLVDVAGDRNLFS